METGNLFHILPFHNFKKLVKSTIFQRRKNYFFKDRKNLHISQKKYLSSEVMISFSSLMKRGFCFFRLIINHDHS